MATNANSTATFFQLMGKVVDFELYTVGALSNSYNNVTIAGVISASDCDKYGVDAYAVHAQIYRQIPEGTMMDDPESYHYIVVQHDNGQKSVIGIPWINSATLKIHNAITATFTVNDIAQEDINVIADVIKRYGYHVKFSVQ